MIVRGLATAAFAALCMAPAAMAQDTTRANQPGQDTVNVVPAQPQPGIQAGQEQNQNQDQNRQQAQQPGQRAGQMALAGDTMPVDTAFLMDALSGNIKEVRLGELAARQAESQEVKEFGRRMVETHRQAYRQTREIASQIGADSTALDEMKPEHEAVVEQLRGLEGEAFDSAYIAMQVRDHAKEVAEYRNQVQAGEQTEIRRYALATLPTLRDHFELAQRTAREVGVNVQTPLAGEMEVGPNDTTAYMRPGADTAAVAPADTGYMPGDSAAMQQPDTGIMQQPDTGNMQQPDTSAYAPGDTTQQMMPPADTTPMPADSMPMQPSDSMMPTDSMPVQPGDTSITPGRDTTMTPGENVPRQAGTPQTPPVQPDTTSGLRPPAAPGDSTRSDDRP